MRELMKDAGGDGATMKIAKRKLNMFGAIQSHSGLANNEKQLNKLKNRHILAASIAQINQLDWEEAAAKDEDEVQERRQADDGALQSLLVKEEMSIRIPSLKLHRFFLLTTLLMSSR
jgi:hypothetical protein